MSFPTDLLQAEKRRQKEELRKEREAVRRKAAIEKATARRIARESMELIEDEQLELMEIAAANKGLSSIISLDHDTLQNLESFRGWHCFTCSTNNSLFNAHKAEVQHPFGILLSLLDQVGNLNFLFFKNIPVYVGKRFSKSALLILKIVV